jgi:hypothetical protein
VRDPNRPARTFSHAVAAEEQHMWLEEKGKGKGKGKRTKIDLIISIGMSSIDGGP